MTTEVTAVPVPRRAGEPARRWRGARVLAWAVVPLYLAGTASYLLLDARLGNPGLDVVEDLPLLFGFGILAATGALADRAAAAQRPRLGHGGERAADRPRAGR